jgi:proteasome lid subunit RPN8/RPN11
MVAHARAELPNECCGLLAATVGSGQRAAGSVKRCYPLVNELASPAEYLSEPTSMFRAVKDMRARGLDIVAVYHSHPTTEPVPSRKDLERRYSEDVVHFIISLRDREPSMRAWWLREDQFTEADWELFVGD